MAGVGEALVSAVLKEVLRKLGSAVGEQMTARWKLRQDMESIKSTLELVQAVLRDAERRSVREEAVSLWLKMLKNAAYDISDMFDDFEVKLSQGKISSSVAKFSMGRKLKNLREKLTNIAAQRSQFGFMLHTCSTDHEEIKKRETTSKVNRATIVGRQKEKVEIVTLLASNREQKTMVIPIFGFGGIGKTTLAKLVFNDDQMPNFDLRAWVYVSPHFDLKMIGKSIISQIKGQVEGLHDLQSVSNSLEEIMCGRSCLIVLDDLWENNCSQLTDLLQMLSNFKKESMIRIIVTTRTEEVARKIGTVTPYKLEPLSDDQCWALFKNISFLPGCPLGEDEKNVMENIGRDIANKCQGVPMAAQALGYMLRNKAVVEWKSVRDSEIWSGSSTTDDVLPSLKLSYYQMSPYLKLCFSYCSVFPKGFEVHRGNLIQQWISLGFIPPSPQKHITLEKVGENYVNELLGMSFVQYSRLTSLSTREDTKNSMLLRMHDLMHDLGRSVIGDELLLVDGEKEYSSSNGNYRYALVLNHEAQMAVCNDEPAKLRALHFSECPEIQLSLFGKSLRILDLGKCPRGNLPASIGKLKQLRYLSAPDMLHKKVPKHVTSLSKLIHLNMSGSIKISTLPDSIDKLRSLLHLDLSGCCKLHSLPESFGGLTNLAHLNLANCSLLETLPKSVDKLRSLLHLDLSGCCNLSSLPESLGDLMNLSHLNLSNCSLLNTLPESVETLRNLLHLDLSGCTGLCSLSESFGELVNLSYLDLENCYDLSSLPKSFGRLCELQYLNLSGCLKLNLKVDIETVCCLTNLQYLNLSRCPSLMHIPESVNNLKNLHTLDLSRCDWIERFPKRLCGMTSVKFLLIKGCSPWLQQRVRESQFKNDMLTLPKFIVQRTASSICMSSNISLLQAVHPAELEIECLQNVTSIEEAAAVNLADKSVLAKLVLAWTPAVGRVVEDEDLLQELQPPGNLKFLKVQGYMGTSFSGWMIDMASCLPHLVCIEMVDLPRCEHLPPFGQLQNLEQLTLKRMPILRKLGTEFCGGSGAFKKLRKFTLIDLETLEEWVTKDSANGEFMFPNLHKLEICRCPGLRLKPCLPRATEWRIQASDEIIATKYDAGSSFSLTLAKLHVTDCHLLPEEWALFEYLPALEILEISNYQKKKLPESLVFLVSLWSLKIDVSNNNQEQLCDWLVFLSAISSDQGLAVFPSPDLTALENLEISLNDESQKWCKMHGRWTLQNVKNKPTTFFERQIANIRKKKDQSLISYIHAVKQLADTLTAVGQTLRDEEIIRLILDHRLGLEDRTLIMRITGPNDDITLNDLCYYLSVWFDPPANCLIETDSD
ncbi:putative disease resistance protein RGA4 isoform X1 [Panicum hallii]|nr:putative disease resistance protein RGA4 isoform X1 [Panicum hallii]